jgi:hypothetical protein
MCVMQSYYIRWEDRDEDWTGDKNELVVDDILRNMTLEKPNFLHWIRPISFLQILRC